MGVEEDKVIQRQCIASIEKIGNTELEHKAPTTFYLVNKIHFNIFFQYNVI